MSDPRYGLFCAVCMSGLSPQTAYIDIDGAMWDLCAEGLCVQSSALAPFINHPSIGCPLEDHSDCEIVG